jgi:hypothetical protein
MLRNPRTVAVGALLVAVVVARGADDGDKGNQAVDDKVYTTLKAVINEGAALYNQGDASGSYRLFQGALMTVGPLLGHRPALQKSIESGLAKAKAAPSCRHQAHELRKVLDSIRSEVGPVKLPPPKEGKVIEPKKADKAIEPKKSDKVIESKKSDGKVIESKEEKKDN